MIRIDKAETDDDSRRTIKESQAVWIEARPESIQALVPELRALLERGGFVGGDVAALGLLPRMESPTVRKQTTLPISIENWRPAPSTSRLPCRLKHS